VVAAARQMKRGTGYQHKGIADCSWKEGCNNGNWNANYRHQGSNTRRKMRWKEDWIKERTTKREENVNKERKLKKS
jgi:hypothetical protein